jgi:MEDS: MEthanogen/methylotroph, DcmR Sensory domain
MRRGSDNAGGSSDGEPPIHLGGTTLGPSRHICAFFNGPDDHYRALLPFIVDGFACGDKAVHIIDPRRRDDHVQRLRSAGLDAATAELAGQLELLGWPDAHLQGGSFDQHRMLGLVDRIRERSHDRGYSRIRFVTQMEWALEDCPGVESLLEYEAMANAGPMADPVVCAYDLGRFGADVVVDVMRTHPMVIIGGVLQENPFYVPPQEFLRELRARRGE